MVDCLSIISQGVQLNCTDPIKKGIERNAVIINKNDIQTITYSKTRKNVIEEIVCKTGKKGYPIYMLGKSPYTGTKTELVVGDYVNTFTHTFAMVILNNGPDVSANIIDGLANGEFVVIFENKHKSINNETTPGDSAFEVFGIEQGLTATTLSNDKYSESTMNGWDVALEETQTSRSATYLYKTSYEATKTSFDSLTTAVTA